MKSLQQSTSLSTGSKTLRLLQEMKQKNERMEQLLRKSLNDVKRLKERELMYQQQAQNFIREERSFQLFSLAPALDFDDHVGGMPGIAMFSLSATKNGQIIQCNQAFQTLIGRTWQELNQGISCCQLFPKRILPLLCHKFDVMASRDGPSSAEGELVIMRPSGEEVAIKAYSHVIFDEKGEALYKIFIAFALQ
jgi:PAS domain-containing protein